MNYIKLGIVQLVILNKMSTSLNQKNKQFYSNISNDSSKNYFRPKSIDVSAFRSWPKTKEIQIRNRSLEFKNMDKTLGYWKIDDKRILK